MLKLVFLVCLLVVLIGVVVYANGQKNKGAMSESTHQTLVSAISILVTIAAVTVLVLRIRGG